MQILMADPAGTGSDSCGPMKISQFGLTIPKIRLTGEKRKLPIDLITIITR
jgi:hypothetical protein